MRPPCLLREAGRFRVSGGGLARLVYAPDVGGHSPGVGPTVPVTFGDHLAAPVSAPVSGADLIESASKIPTGVTSADAGLFLPALVFSTIVRLWSFHITWV